MWACWANYRIVRIRLPVFEVIGNVQAYYLDIINYTANEHKKPVVMRNDHAGESNIAVPVRLTVANSDGVVSLPVYQVIAHSVANMTPNVLLGFQVEEMIFPLVW